MHERVTWECPKEEIQTFIDAKIDRTMELVHLTVEGADLIKDCVIDIPFFDLSPRLCFRQKQEFPVFKIF